MQKVVQLASHLSNTQDAYPSAESVHLLQQQFNLESLEETRHLLNLARQYLKRRTKDKPLTETQKSKVRECVERAVQSRTEFPIDELYSLVKEQTNLSGRYVLRLVERHSAKMALASLPDNVRSTLTHRIEMTANTRALLDEFEQITEGRISRHVLSVFLRAQQRRFSITNTCEKDREHVQHHVEQSAHPLNTSLLCDELSSDSMLNHLPRRALLTLVRYSQQRIMRSHVTKAQRDWIDAHVAAASPGESPQNLAQLCSELEKELNIPKHILYDMVRAAWKRHFRSSLDHQQREEIRVHVQASEHGNVALLCDELQRQMQVPRDVLMEMVRDEVRKQQQSEVTSEQRALVREYVLRSPRPLNAQQICTKLQSEQYFLNLPRFHLYRLVRKSCDVVERKMIGREEKQFVEQHVAERKGVHDVSTLCDELQDRLKGVSRGVLYKMVHGAVKKRDKVDA